MEVKDGRLKTIFIVMNPITKTHIRDKETQNWSEVSYFSHVSQTL